VGRPATGQDPVSAVRLPADLTKEIDSWARKNDTASRSEAIRRLVELGLKAKK
jgi:metal-responsive CopG/Arc/MetJ family transcriptional regulator